MAQNTSVFLEALDRSETTRDGGFKHSWGFSLPDDREKAKRPEPGPVSVEEMEQHQTTCPEETSPPFRRFGSGPSRVYENRSNSHIRPLNKLLPKTISSIHLTPPTSSPWSPGTTTSSSVRSVLQECCCRGDTSSTRTSLSLSP